jgi:alkylation response protein AidB-like acyl-CoA dehydrogenase
MATHAPALRTSIAIMDFDDTPEEARFRQEARTFLEAHAPAGGLRYDQLVEMAERVRKQRDWQQVLHRNGWAVPTWPVAWGGRGLSPAQSAIWQQECARVDVGEGVLNGGLSMLGPTLIAHGSEEQRKRFLPKTARGEILWAQLFSEPGSGSDLASLATRAARDGDDWVVNGQKVWSSFANYADMGFLLARTDPRAPKHQGMVYLLVDLAQPGVEVRPLVEMTGGNHFNEVFLSDVRVPDANRVGPEHGGWAVARTTLMLERTSIGSFSALRHVEKLLGLVRQRGSVVPAVLADRIARLYSHAKGLDLLNKRMLTAVSHGGVPGAEGSVMKNAMADLMLDAADLGMTLLGDEAIARGHLYEHDFLFAPSMHIGGGTQEIMKSLVAEQVLGLPREPDAWKGRPFDEVPRS